MINPEQFREESIKLGREADDYEYSGDSSDVVEVLGLRITSVLYEIGAQIIMRQDLMIRQLANIPGATTAAAMLKDTEK